MLGKKPLPATREPVTFQQALEGSPLFKICGDDGCKTLIPSFIVSMVMLVTTLVLWISFGVATLSLATMALFLLTGGLTVHSIFLAESLSYRHGLVERRRKRLNSKIPWKPREGERHPTNRDDLWPRWTVRVTSGEKFTVNLIHWQCDPHTMAWHEAGRKTIEVVDLEDIEALGEARFKAQTERDRLGKEEQEQWLLLEAEKQNAEDQLQLRCQRKEEERRLQDSNRELARSLSD